MTVLLPPGGQRIMAILAHPDDAEYLCGGTMAHLVREGHDVHYLLVTRGDKGSDDPDMTPERLAAIREDEQRQAASALGVQTVTFLDGYYDGAVEATLGLRQELTLAIRQWRPDVIFTFDPWKRYELHPDHRAVGLSTFDAIAAARGRMNYPEQLRDGIAAHRVGDVYFFATDQPNHWVEISDVLNQQLEAIHCHASQMQEKSDAFVRHRARLTGVEHKYAFAEAFYHYRV